MDCSIPLEYIHFIADHAPDTMSNYLMLWKEQDHDCRCICTKQYIRDEKSKSWTKFLNDLRKLCCQGLLEWSKADEETVVIVLAAYDSENGPFSYA